MCYVIALRMLRQQTHFTGIKLFTIITVTWEDRDVASRRKNSKIHCYLPFLDKCYINTWCLRGISSERTNTVAVYIFL